MVPLVIQQRQTIIQPIGLITQPNTYGQYPSGALRTARNVVLRNPGELVQAQDVSTAVTVAAANSVLLDVFPVDSNHVFSWTVNGTTWALYDNTLSMPLPANASPALNPHFSSTGRITPVRTKDRVVVNSTDFGALVVDSAAPTTLAERTWRKGGLQQPGLRVFSQTATNGAALPNNTTVGYAVCFVREFADGYVVRSVPSSVYKYANVSGFPLNIILTVSWETGSILATDRIEVYRTDGIPTSGTFGYGADPGNTFKLVASVYATAAGAGIQSITDAQPFVPATTTTAGRELYTNPGQEGSTFANRLPPIAAVVATFKGYTFYGRTTDRPKLTFAINGGIGAETSAVSAGFTAAYYKAFSIGRHSATGTYTIGSPTITGVAAADFVGLEVGQAWATGAAWATGSLGTAATIAGLNSGAGTITMSANSAANSGGPVAIFFNDQLELNGTKFSFIDLSDLFSELNANALNNAAFFGRWELTVDQSVAAVRAVQYLTQATVSIEPGYPQFTPSGFTVRATNGARYQPPLPLINGGTAQTISANTLKNHLAWSKQQQPEHAPSVLEDFVGYGEIIAMNPTRDALWIWCTDGLYRLSGDGGADGLAFRVDVVSTTLILAAPQASAVLEEVVYGYTNQGFVAVDSAGSVQNLTDMILDPVLPGAKYVETAKVVVERSEVEGEILLMLGENGNGFSDVIYVYNSKTKGWTQLAQNASIANVTAMAMQRDTAGAQGALLFGMTPLGGVAPKYAQWNSGANFLTPAIEFQPIYGDDPLQLKQWIWADYLFAPGSNGKTFQPTWNAVTSGTVTIQDLENSGYGRSGVPRSASIAHSIAPGLTGLAGAPQTRFQGISVNMSPLSNQGRKR